MEGLFADGRIVDFILIAMVVEGVALLIYRQRTRRGVAPADLVVNLLAGACLLLALRASLVNAAWPWSAIWLAAALIMHGLDLRRRWR